MKYRDSGFLCLPARQMKRNLGFETSFQLTHEFFILMCTNTFSMGSKIKERGHITVKLPALFLCQYLK